MIQIAAYSYDYGVAPYTQEGQQLSLLQIFTTLLEPDEYYDFSITMTADGQSTFRLHKEGVFVEEHVVQHLNLCENYYEGTVHGLYFGGTCTAPENVSITYIS